MLNSIAKAFVLPLLVSSTVLCAANKKKAQEEVINSTNYFSIGVGPLPVLLPNFGLGHRYQNNHHGFDVSLSGTTIVIFSQVKASALYDYYFKPNLNSQFYMGAGLGMGGIFGNRDVCHEKCFFVSPEFVFGKQYKNEAKDTRFIQAEVSWPTIGRGTLWMPLVVFSYGMCF